jgi:hypothetical protein
MSEPWFDPNQFGAWYGAIAGGGGGTLLGLLGGLMGTFLPKGKGRKTFSAILFLGALFGACSFAVGIIALGMKQPFGIWFSLLLVGFLYAVICSLQLVVVQVVCKSIEQRKMQAGDLREI